MTNRSCASARDQRLLLSLQRDALNYFLDNQHSSGLFLDRQANHGPLRDRGLCSVTVTGMGLIAVALASLSPHRLLTTSEACLRIARGMEAALALPHTCGMLPHFVNSESLRPVGIDRRSTIDTAWLLAGAMCCEAIMNNAQLTHLADQLCRRVQWDCWIDPRRGLISHGRNASGRPLGGVWDRFNAETFLLLILAAAGSEQVRLPADLPTSIAGLTFPSAELGLFVSQYSLELVDVRDRHPEGVPDLVEAAGLAVDVNREVCIRLADTFKTYRHFWGLSAGDGPGDGGAQDAYRAYSPSGPVDGTAHVTATLASLAHRPAQVWELINHALAWPLPIRGRYGFSNINLDREWISPDVVGIDVGMAAFALDNVLFENRLRRIFQSLPLVGVGLRRLGFEAESGFISKTMWIPA